MKHKITDIQSLLEKFDTTSFRAKPRAKPVSPNPATKADTFIPIVPSAVTRPKIIKPIFVVRPMSFSNSGFNPRLLANRIIKNWVKTPLIQKRINIAILAITAGKISKMF